MVEAVAYGSVDIFSEPDVYLVHFRKHWQHLDFCLQEIESLADMHGIKREQLYASDPAEFNPKVNPTIYVRLPSQDVCKQIVARSILIKEIIDVFASTKLEAMPRRDRSDRDEEDKEEESPPKT